MQRVQDFFRYLTTPQASLREPQQHEARVLTSILLAFILGGLAIMLVLAFFVVAPEERRHLYSGSLWTLVLLGIPYLIIWRTRFFLVGLLLAIVSFDLALVTTVAPTIRPEPIESLNFALYALIPVILSSIFLRLHHTAMVAAIQLGTLLLISAGLPSGNQQQFWQNLPLSFVMLSLLIMVFATAFRVRLENERQRELGESEQLHRTLLETAFEGILVVRDGEIFDANRGLERLSGYAWHDLTQRPLADLFVAPLPAFSEPTNAVMIHADRTPIPVEVVSRPITLKDAPGRVYALRNITERARADAAMQEVRTLLEETVRARTLELEQLNTGLQSEIARRMAIESELRQSREGLRDLYSREQQARWFSEVLRDANLSLTKSLDLKVVLDSLLSFLARLVPYESANVMLLEDADSMLRIVAVKGYENWQADTQALNLRIPVDRFPNMARLVREGKSAWVPDTQLDPSWITIEPGAHVRSWLGVPLHVAGRVLGVYSLDRTVPNGFTKEHVRTAEALAAQAAVAIENARLYTEINEKREMLRRMTTQEMKVLEDERGRIAHALHDESGQALTALQFLLRSLRDAIPLDGRPAVDPLIMQWQLNSAIELTGVTMEQLRAVAHFLRPVALDDLGLSTALEGFCEEFAQYVNLDVRYEGKETGELPDIVAVSLYRLVQEALTNVARHADAATAVVTLEQTGSLLTLAVCDDGRGFDTATQNGQGIGLIGMRERVLALGGEIQIHSQPDRGTEIRVTVDLADWH